MSRLTIDISPEQHKSLKAKAALEGKTIRQYALERLFPNRASDAMGEAGESGRTLMLGELLDKDESLMDEAEKAAWASFLRFLEQRTEEARFGAAGGEPSMASSTT